MEDNVHDDMKTQRAGTSLKFNRYSYDNLMAIYARACFQSKNEISDKLMRNDFNAISSVTPDGTVICGKLRINLPIHTNSWILASF